ncbi:hypothetical protein QGM71_16540 [Virgibacillus sp. C22-A2]|uniref:SnoaL-like domain-containing protein n=1 Tax=Virgibacillus tibetensis TaxID=3042313 RepID=A0ABU6KIQ1_9BACI|nr:hypothetical protein [Virgibacillus sp. C22-A2]
MSKNQEFFKKINNAFTTGDVDFIIENVTEDLQWNMVGNSHIQGKESFVQRRYSII